MRLATIALWGVVCAGFLFLGGISCDYRSGEVDSTKLVEQYLLALSEEDQKMLNQLNQDVADINNARVEAFGLRENTDVIEIIVHPPLEPSILGKIGKSNVPQTLLHQVEVKLRSGTLLYVEVEVVIDTDARAVVERAIFLGEADERDLP